MTERTFIHEIEDKYGLESELEVYFQFFTMLQKNMETYCVRCRKEKENLSPKIFETKNGRLIMQSKCAECAIKKSRFVKEQEVTRN